MMNTLNSKMIDVIIPCHKKDYDTLPLCIRSIRENVEDEIKDIFIISKSCKEIKDICSKYKCKFIDEIQYMGFSPEDLTTIIKRCRGWLFQQLIKLKGNPGICENYLVIDSDVLIVKKYKFLNEDLTPNFFMLPVYSLDYYHNTNKKLIGYRRKENDSFISDKMIFNVNTIKELQNKIEQYTKENWMTAIINNFNNVEVFSFSEFELYGTYYELNKNCNKIYPLEKHMSKKFLGTYEDCINKFKDFNSITFYCDE